MFNAVKEFVFVLFQWRVWGSLGVIQVHRQHSRALIGPVWTIFQAAAWIGLIAIVFTPLFKDDFPEYLSYVAIAVIAYNIAAHVLGSSSDAIVRHYALVWNTPIRIMLLPMMTISSGAYKALLQLPVLLIALAIEGDVNLAQAWLLVPTTLIFLIFLIFLIGTSFLFSVLGAFSGDFRFAVQISMRFLFFATPIFWIVPETASMRRYLAVSNPLTHFLDAYRAALLGFEYALVNLGWLAIFSVSLFLLSIYLFEKVKTRMLVAI